MGAHARIGSQTASASLLLFLKSVCYALIQCHTELYALPRTINARLQTVSHILNLSA